MNLYEILNLNSNASSNDIKRSYKKLALLYHPDRNNNEVNKFYLISTAYSVLSDPIKKAQYDLCGYINKEDKSGIGIVENTIKPTSDFFNIINDICSKIFNKTKFYEEIDKDINITEMLNNNKKEMADDYVLNLLKQHLTITIDDDSSLQLESECEMTDDKTINNTDTIIDLIVNIEEIYKGLIKVVMFERQVYIDDLLIIETTKLNVPICNDKIIFENEGNDYINDNNVKMKGNVIVYVKCLRSKYYKRVNEYDIMIMDNVTDQEIKNGYEKQLTYFDKIVTLKCKNPESKIKNNKIITKLDNHGIKHYFNGDFKKPHYGSLIVVLFKK